MRYWNSMRVVLISTYESGHQPFGLASPAAWLRARGHEVTCADLAVERLPEEAVRSAGLIAIYLPMHTATRLAEPVLRSIGRLNPDAHIAAYGLYAPLNGGHLRELGVDSIIGGEFEAALVNLADGALPGEFMKLDRLQFVTPDRSDLPVLNRYARLMDGDRSLTAGYTEASRGCKHLCRHCPVVPVYQGAFRVVQADVVLDDIRQQVAAGAQHITFGDPDFFNGPSHARRIVQAFRREFPGMTYDATIKVEHLLRHRDLLGVLRETGCVFVTTAVESVDDAVLGKLDKGHTRADFYQAVGLCREVGLSLSPTFIAFTPWTTRAGYVELLQAIRDLDLVDNVNPVQLALRLLITRGSRLLELEDVRARVQEFDSTALVWKWAHEEPSMDALAREALAVAGRAAKSGQERRETFRELWELAGESWAPDDRDRVARAAVPYLNEPWYC